MLSISFHALFADVNAYCILKSGKTCVRTSSVRGSTQILWQEQFVFHRFDAHLNITDYSALSEEKSFRASSSQHFTIELWKDRSLSTDNMMSRIHFPAEIDNDTRELQLKLTDSLCKVVGYLKLIVATFDDPMYL